jgi:hypothetical protein
LISISHIRKKGKQLKKEEKAKERKEKVMSGEKSEGEEKMDKCSTGQKNPPLRKKKGIKTEE